MVDSLLDRQALCRIMMQHALDEFFQLFRKWIIHLTLIVLDFLFDLFLKFNLIHFNSGTAFPYSHINGDIFIIFFLLSPELRIVTVFQMLVIIVLIFDICKRMV
jgi:hypothetical protein